MAFKPSKIKKHNIHRVQAKLSLNSMMDIFIIILLFLLKTYSAQGHLFSHLHDLQLPVSQQENQPDRGLELVVSPEMIYFENMPVVPLVSVMSNAPEVVQNGIILPLKKTLEGYSSEGRLLEERYGIRFSGALSVKADRNLDYAELVKIMQTCGNAGFSNLHLVVLKN